MTEPISVTSIDSLLKAMDEVYSAFEHQPWWRGHGRHNYELVPHVHRITDRGTGYETNIALKFSRMAPTRYTNCPAPEDGARWLVLMQHYRLPTRLLDWTESPLIALYFAVANEKHDSEDGTLWALDPFLLNELHGEEDGVLKLGHAGIKRLVGLALSKSVPSDEAVYAIAADEIDIRMLVQLSGMTLHGSREPLEKRDSADRYLRTFRVGSEAKAALRTALKKLGIRERNLFPDLEHLASDLKTNNYPD